MNLPLDAQARIENVQRLMNGWMGGIGGVILCGFGVAAVAALGAVLYGWAMQPAGSGAKPLVLAAVLAIVAAFCFVAGSRLMLNRPNASGSLLSPTAWIVLGVIIAAPVIAASVLNPAGARPAPALVWLAALAFAALCFWRAFAITHPASASAAVRRLSRFAPWLGLPLGVAIAAIAGVAWLQSGRLDDLLRAAAFGVMTPVMHSVGFLAATRTGTPDLARLPKWVRYLLWLAFVLLVASLAVRLAGA